MACHVRAGESGVPGVLLGPDMYHVYDHSLFYGNIRENARTRVRAFLSSRLAWDAPVRRAGGAAAP